MDALFHFPSAVTRSPVVEQWFASQPPGLGDRARRWFERVRACGPDVRELMHDGHPTACAGDAAFAYTAVHAAHVNLGFYRGAYLPDPAGLLHGTGKRMRHVKLVPGEALDERALERLINAAYRDIRARVAALPASD